MCDDRIVIVGFGGHGKSVADAILRQGKYRLVGFTDMSFKEPYIGYPYLVLHPKTEHFEGLDFLEN